MASISERVRRLKDRVSSRRAGSSQGDRAERARRRAEAKAVRLEHKRKGLGRIPDR